jgi:hypothetical protein
MKTYFQWRLDFLAARTLGPQLSEKELRKRFDSYIQEGLSEKYSDSPEKVSVIDKQTRILEEIREINKSISHSVHNVDAKLSLIRWTTAAGFLFLFLTFWGLKLKYKF